MARVPCAPVPDTGRQGTIEVLKYGYCFLGMPNLEIPQRLSMSGPQSQSKCRCFPPNPPFRPGLADQTGSPLASRDVRAAVTQGPSGTPPRQSVNIKPPHSSTTPPLPSPPPAYRYPAPPPSWQHCPRVPESLRRTFVDFPCWTLDLALRFPLSSSSPVRNEINY